MLQMVIRSFRWLTCFEGFMWLRRLGGGRGRVNPPPRRLVWRFWEVWRVWNLVGASTRLEARGLGGLISLRHSRRGTWRLRGLSPLYRTRRGETERPLSESGHDKSIRHPRSQTRHSSLYPLYPTRRGETECPLSESGHDKSMRHPKSRTRHPSLSPLYQTRRGETEHPLSESGHDKSIRHPRSQTRHSEVTNTPC